MKLKKMLEKLSSGKGFYITAGLSLVIIIASIVFVYTSSVNLIEQLEVPTTPATQKATEQRVEKPQENVSDPRRTTARQTTAPTTTAESKTTEPVSDKKEETTAKQREEYILPSQGEIIKAFSKNAVYDETMEDWRSHMGVDFSCEKGEEVFACADGKVVRVVADTAYGYTIEVDCGDFTAKYCGILQGSCVGIDDAVRKGQVIGQLGDIPCEAKQESHLHFEIIAEGERVDPVEYLTK